MIGILLALIVVVFWSLGEANYSKISQEYNRRSIYFYTYFIRTILYLAVVFIFQRSLFGTFQISVLAWILPIILCDLVASLVINIAVYNGKLSIVSPIMAAYPVVDIFLGMFFLKEKIVPLQIILCFVINLSIIVLVHHVTKSKKAKNPIKGINFAVLYMLLVALSSFFEKYCYQENISVYQLYYYKGMIYGLTSFFFFLVCLFRHQLRKPNKDIIKGCGYTPIGNIFYSFALSFGNISVVAPISSMYSVVTHFISRFQFKEKISLIEKICIYIIIIATLWLILLEVL